jgi:integrase/recombinase XerD
MKISTALEGFWLEKRRQVSPRTVENYTRIFNQFIDHLGDLELEQVTTIDIRRHLDHLERVRRLSKRSVYDAWVGLSSLWTWASAELGIPHIIRSKIKAPKYPKTDVDPFTRDDIKALLRACEYSNEWETGRGKITQSKRDTWLRDRAIVLTLVDSGIRSSELCDLTIADYDTGRGRLHIRHGKGDKARYVFLGDRTRKALWKYLNDRPGAKQAEPLFATRSKTHITRRNLGHLLNHLAERAGVEHCHPHRFRHTMAINFLRNGGNTLELQKVLGHESLEMVRRYARLAESDLERTADKSVGDNWKL